MKITRRRFFALAAGAAAACVVPFAAKPETVVVGSGLFTSKSQCVVANGSPRIVVCHPSKEKEVRAILGLNS